MTVYIIMLSQVFFSFKQCFVCLCIVPSKWFKVARI